MVARPSLFLHADVNYPRGESSLRNSDCTPSDGKLNIVHNVWDMLFRTTITGQIIRTRAHTLSEYKVETPAGVCTVSGETLEIHRAFSRKLSTRPFPEQIFTRVTVNRTRCYLSGLFYRVPLSRTNTNADGRRIILIAVFYRAMNFPVFFFPLFSPVRVIEPRRATDSIRKEIKTT